MIPTSEQCRAIANEFKNKSQAANVSEAQAFIMKNIARSFTGVATQLDTLDFKIKEEARQRDRSMPSYIPGKAGCSTPK